VRWRAIGRPGEPYPEWLRSLRDRSGAYAIRVGGRVVYVGESHKGRLYGTITRHFQGWRRKKNFWRDLFGSGADPGFTYDRASAEVMVKPCSSSHAIAAQNHWILRLRPRDNTVGKLEDAPF
jgi:hypothetical protein